MSRIKTSLSAALTLIALLALCALPSCSLGYTNLHPGENSALYAPLFNDIINVYDSPHWLWIRGTIAGDMDGNGTLEEEVIVATIQKGDRYNPGPIELAILVVCKKDADDQRVAIARTIIFDRNPIPGSPTPINDLGLGDVTPLTRTRAQMVSDKVTLKETVVVYFWGDEMPGNVWYVGYSLDSGKLVKNFETAMRQPAPGFIAANLDRSIDASPYGYQLIFSAAAIPDPIARKVGSINEIPLWGHVYARGSDGVYKQADVRFGQHYSQIENSWNQFYLRAMIMELPPEELAWFEYHLGLLNNYTGNTDMASRFLEKAAKNARDERLKKAVEDGINYIHGKQ